MAVIHQGVQCINRYLVHHSQGQCHVALMGWAANMMYAREECQEMRLEWMESDVMGTDLVFKMVQAQFQASKLRTLASILLTPSILGWVRGVRASASAARHCRASALQQVSHALGHLRSCETVRMIRVWMDRMREQKKELDEMKMFLLQTDKEIALRKSGAHKIQAVLRRRLLGQTLACLGQWGRNRQQWQRDAVQTLCKSHLQGRGLGAIGAQLQRLFHAGISAQLFQWRQAAVRQMQGVARIGSALKRISRSRELAAIHNWQTAVTASAAQLLLKCGAMERVRLILSQLSQSAAMKCMAAFLANFTDAKHNEHVDSLQEEIETQQAQQEVFSKKVLRQRNLAVAKAASANEAETRKAIKAILEQVAARFGEQGGFTAEALMEAFLDGG